MPSPGSKTLLLDFDGALLFISHDSRLRAPGWRRGSWELDRGSCVSGRAAMTTNVVAESARALEVEAKHAATGSTRSWLRKRFGFRPGPWKQRRTRNEGRVTRASNNCAYSAAERRGAHRAGWKFGRRKAAPSGKLVVRSGPVSTILSARCRSLRFFPRGYSASTRNRHHRSQRLRQDER